MLFEIDTARINEWRAEQRPRLNSAGQLDLAEVKLGRTPAQRMASLTVAAMFFAMPVSGFYFLAALLPRLGSGTPKMLACLVFIAIAGAMAKVGFSALREGLGAASRDDVLWRAASAHARKKDFTAALRCLAEALTHPWKKRLTPRADDAYALWSEARAQHGTPVDLMTLVADLLFVEMLLDVALNSNSSFAGLVGPEGISRYRRAMTDLASDSGNLSVFASLYKQMAPRQHVEGTLHPILEDLAGRLRHNAPNAADVIATEFPAKTRPIHSTSRVDTVVNFAVEGGDLDVRDDSGSSLLHIAAAQGKAELTLTLLAYGANPHITNHDGKTPLDLARGAGHEVIAAQLAAAAELSDCRQFSNGDLPEVSSPAQLWESAGSGAVLLFTAGIRRGFADNVAPAVRLALSREQRAPVLCWASMSVREEITRYLKLQKMGAPGVLIASAGAIHGYRRLGMFTSREDQIRAALELVAEYCPNAEAA